MPQSQRTLKVAWLLAACWFMGGFGASMNVITDSSSSFASPDPSEPKYIVTLAGARGPSTGGGDADPSSAPGAEATISGHVSGGDVSSTEAAALLPGADSSAAAAATTTTTDDGRRIVMTAANGRRYSCLLPGGGGSSEGGVAEATGGVQVAGIGGGQAGVLAAAAAAVEAAAAAAAGEKSPQELLEAMSALCLYRQEGLWTYEVCYKKHVRQFRQDGSGRNEDFSCGKYTGDEVQDFSIMADASSTPVPIRYISHRFHEGAKCTMTGGPRSAEVRFTCLPDTADNVLVSIKEFPTCNYVFVVTTPFLCKHRAFRPTPEQHLGISCEPLPVMGQEPEDESELAGSGGSREVEVELSTITAGAEHVPASAPAPAPATADSAGVVQSCEASDGSCGVEGGPSEPGERDGAAGGNAGDSTGIPAGEEDVGVADSEDSLHVQSEEVDAAR